MARNVFVTYLSKAQLTANTKRAMLMLQVKGIQGLLTQSSFAYCQSLLWRIDLNAKT